MASSSFHPRTQEVMSNHPEFTETEFQAPYTPEIVASWNANIHPVLVEYLTTISSNFRCGFDQVLITDVAFMDFSTEEDYIEMSTHLPIADVEMNRLDHKESLNYVLVGSDEKFDYVMSMKNGKIYKFEPIEENQFPYLNLILHCGSLYEFVNGYVELLIAADVADGE